MSPAWATVALLLGLVHAGHCAAMCGPFALRAAAAPHARAGWAAWALGKTFTYVFLGALAGSAGASAVELGTDAGRLLGWAVGLGLVLAGGRRLLRPPSPGWLDRALGRSLGALAAPLRGLGADAPLAGRFALGALTGALPCGVVYLAALQALALGDGARGAAFMALFGAGTWPALLGVAWAGGAARGRLGPRAVRYAGGLLVLLVGLLTLWRAGLPGLDATCPACFS